MPVGSGRKVVKPEGTAVTPEGNEMMPEGRELAAVGSRGAVPVPRGSKELPVPMGRVEFAYGAPAVPLLLELGNPVPEALSPVPMGSRTVELLMPVG